MKVQTVFATAFLLVARNNQVAAFTPLSAAAGLSTARSPQPAPALFSSKSNVNLSENDANTSEESHMDVASPSLTAQQSAQTIAYRASLLGGTAAYSLQSALPILQDAGLSIPASSSSLDAMMIATGFTVAACALAPKPNKKLVDGKVLAAGAATAIAGQPLLGLAALCVREIFYFGLAYKVEAAVGILASLAVWFVPELMDASQGVVSLALAVMVIGKFLEPLEEDWQPNQSEFLAQNEMK